ncbi:hypothetical protein FGE12_21470 [Aggregicoccus sp. 17bor-14]|uniref:hypothetical protein n=1 Tax=Myxococcaceae TaxID=31 RepID=UPI00129C77FC|nr:MULTISPECIES: hypothetical protein [Myxococcaceae]MBF5044986.1 hypothetical protein [Simulacricoccus sp. 17bor-14]MRI90729.1 hypothetical protein [Aggregicoccus sp. 17bor-14]
MATTPRSPSPEPASTPEPTREARAPEPPHVKETCPKEALNGLPGYGEPPFDVRKDRLADQSW